MSVETNQLELDLLINVAARKALPLDGVLCRVEKDVGVTRRDGKAGTLASFSRSRKRAC